MLRGSRDVRSLGQSDRDEALHLCRTNPAANVYVAARILETNLDRSPGVLLGHCPGGQLQSLLWVSANVVPVRCGPAAVAAFAHRLRGQRDACSSIFGPATQVASLWDMLTLDWGAPLDLRMTQPLLAVTPQRLLGVAADSRVRRATLDEVDLVVTASAAMFTEEIGYPPFVDRASEVGYWGSVRSLIAKGHCFVVIENGQLLFKADIGSVGIGTCQVQGVWVDPSRRGRGLAAPAMAGVVDLARQFAADLVTLYVNDYNAPAMATYRRVGFEPVGNFATVLV